MPYASPSAAWLLIGYWPRVGTFCGQGIEATKSKKQPVLDKARREAKGAPG